MLPDELWLCLQFLKRWWIPFVIHAVVLFAWPSVILCPFVTLFAWWLADVLLTRRSEQGGLVFPLPDLKTWHTWISIFFASAFFAFLAKAHRDGFRGTPPPEYQQLSFAIRTTVPQLVISAVMMLLGNTYKTFVREYSTQLLQGRATRKADREERRQARIAARDKTRQERKEIQERRKEELENRADRRIARLNREYSKRLRAIRRMRVPKEEKEELLETAHNEFQDQVHTILQSRTD